MVVEDRLRTPVLWLPHRVAMTGVDLQCSIPTLWVRSTLVPSLNWLRSTLTQEGAHLRLLEIEEEALEAREDF